MSTTIEWTDVTWNPVTGCTKVSPGCKLCYAKALHDMRHKAHQNGKPMPEQYAEPFERVQCWPNRLEMPLGWRAPRLCFVNSMADLFHEDVPFDFISQILFRMTLTPHITYQALTKRAGRMLEYFTGEQWKTDKSLSAIAAEMYCWPLPNFWLGVSVESKKYLGRIDTLRQVPAAVRMVSFEPLLEDLGEVNLEGIGWAIVGGESGKGARPMHPDWVRNLREQCNIAGVPFFFKQWGEWLGAERGSHQFLNKAGSFRPENVIHCWGRSGYTTEPTYSIRVGKKEAGALLDGRKWREFPKPYPGHQVVRMQRKKVAV